MTATSLQQLKHAPTLNTVLMVERVLMAAEESAITVAEIKRRLPKQVNHNALRAILSYLEYSNKIAVSLNGITWINNKNERMRTAIRNGLEL